MYQNTKILDLDAWHKIEDTQIFWRIICAYLGSYEHWKYINFDKVKNLSRSASLCDAFFIISAGSTTEQSELNNLTLQD